MLKYVIYNKKTKEFLWFRNYNSPRFKGTYIGKDWEVEPSHICWTSLDDAKKDDSPYRLKKILKANFPLKDRLFNIKVLSISDI